MIYFRIFLSTLTGTSLMTLFSYVMSDMRRKQFREPVLLNKLLYRTYVLRIPSDHPAGWIIHYGVGLLFNILYWIVIDYHGYRPGLFLFVVLGAISGILGCLVWEVTFQLHPDSPRTNFREFYGQLFFAHVLFGFGSWLPYTI